MSNIAYEGFCPNCHNYWIFCDCVHSFGTIGEDLAKDEGEEEDNDDEEVVDDKPDTLPNVDDLLNDPTLFSPGPSTPGFNGTPGDPTVLSPTNPDNPVTPSFSAPWGAATPGVHLNKPSYTPRDRIKDDAKRINDMLDNINDLPFEDIPIPGGKRRRPNPGPRPTYDSTMQDTPQGDMLPGARLPDSYNSDIQQQVPPSDFVVDDDMLLMPPTDLNDMLNNAADNLPRNAKYDLHSLHRKYTLNGEPEFVRRGPRPDILRKNNMPVFTGSIYGVNDGRSPANLSTQEKNSPDFLSKEYVDFLNDILRPWIDNLSPEVAMHFDTDCYVSDPKDDVPLGTTTLGDFEVSRGHRNGDYYSYVVKDVDSEISIRTKMKLSKNFFETVHPDQLMTLLKGPNTNNVYEFVTEYTNGTVGVVDGQNQQGLYPGVKAFVSGVYKISYGDYPTFYHESSWDNDNEIVKPPFGYVQTFYYRKNTVDNTRRLSGTGTDSDPFVATYENYNSGTFMTTSHGKESSFDANAYRTTADNWGDPLYEATVVYNSGSEYTSDSLIFKYIYEMINTSNDPDYTESTYGLFKIKYSCQAFSCHYNLWIEKPDGSKVYPRIVTSTLTTIKPEGDPSTVAFSNASGTVDKFIYALIECPANDNYLNSAVTPHQNCCINLQFYAPTISESFRGIVKEVSQLVKVNTLPQTFIPKSPTESIGGELVGVGKIIPSSFESEDGLIQMSDVDYKNIWTKTLIWRRTNNTTTIYKFMVDSTDTKTHDFDPYIPSSSAAARQYYQIGTYINNAGEEDYTDSDFVLFNNTSTYPITSLSNDILHRATMTMSFADFIF